MKVILKNVILKKKIHLRTYKTRIRQNESNVYTSWYGRAR